MGNTILVIGNGFDLYHKLPTRYTDFLSFAKGWGKFKAIYDSYRNSDEKVEQLGIKPSEPFEVRLNEHITNNAWIEYFEKTDYRKVGWIDFEKEMEKVLQCVEEYYTREIIKYSGKVPNKFLPMRMSSIILWFGKKANQPFKNLNGLMVTPDDLEMETLEKQKRALLDAMKKEMDALNQCLYYYLAEFVSRIKCNLYSEQVKKLQHVHLLNFNYTYTYHTVYGKTKLIEHHPIHGELRGNNLVLGVSDDSFGNLDYVYFQKYFQRIQKKTGAYYKKWIPQALKSMEDAPAIVHIIGHSLDKTDKGILKEIFLARYVEKIYIYYHNQSAYESQVINLIQMFDKDFIIEQTAIERIEFRKLEEPIVGSIR